MKKMKRAAGLWGLIAAWLLGAPAAWAVRSVSRLNYQDPVPAAPPSLGGMLLRLVISLVIVILLAALLIRFLQRYSLPVRQSNWARVMDQVPLGQNRSLVLAEIFGRVYVLAVTDHGVSTLLKEEDLDLSLLKRVIDESELRSVSSPLFKGKTFLQTLESKIGGFRKGSKGLGE